MQVKPASDMTFLSSGALYFSRAPNPDFAYPGGEHISMLLYPRPAISLSVAVKSFSMDSLTIQLWKPIEFLAGFFALSKPGESTEAPATAAALFMINDLRVIGFIDSG